MPVPDTQGVPPFADFEMLKAKINEIVQKYNNLLVNMDSLNVVSLTADHIDAGTLNANVVTIRADYPGGAYIVLDSNGMRINDGTEDVLVADTAGNVMLRGTIYALAGVIGGWTIGPDKLSGAGAIEGGTITGSTIRSGQVGTNHIELDSGGFRGVTSSGETSGLMFNITETGIVDLFLMHLNKYMVEFYNNLTHYTIRSGVDAARMSIGGVKTTYAVGNWDFSEATSISGIPISAINDLQDQLNDITSQLQYLNDNAFVNARRDGNFIEFDSKNDANVDSVDIS